MSNKAVKTETVGELVARLHPPILNERQISQFQEIGKRHAEMIQNIQKIAKPIIEQMNKVREQARLFMPTSETIIYHRPVEYDILEELQEMNRNHKQLYASQESSGVIVYDTKSGSLDRNLGGKCFSYDLTENGKRKKLLDILLVRGGYVQTKELEDILESTAVAKIVQTFNDYAVNALRLKGVKVIQGKKGSGYRINPKIHIEKE
jgi:hypothetical protein